MNITTVSFGAGDTIAISEGNLWQYDYGQILKIQGLDLPAVYTVDFANIGDTETISMIGDENGVQIPDDLLTTGKSIYAYVWLHTGNNDGETEYKIGIPVFPRPERGDEEPTPAQQSIIDQLIIQLNNGIEHVDEIAESIGEPVFARGTGSGSAVQINEAYPNQANGVGALAAGSGNVAFGAFSTAFGRLTTANTACTMTAGWGTNALGARSFVSGRYNVIDTSAADSYGQRKFAVIVGNGMADDARSNAATLDWDGNAVFAGKATVGAAPANDMDVATKKYVDDAVARIESLLNSITIENGVLTFRRGVNE